MSTTAVPPGVRVLDRKPRPEEGNFRWIYLWGLPLRIGHWVAAICIVVLMVTGFYIGRPFFSLGDPATYTPFFMGWMRFIHFLAASLVVAVSIWRVYWLFFGNKFESWKALFPVKPKDWRNLFTMGMAYVKIQPEKAPHYLGHNPLQQFSYTGMYVVALVQVLTGFALYGLSNPGGFFFSLLGWMGTVPGSWQMVRFIHHVLLWAWAIFIPIHVYLAIRSTILEREGNIGAIFSGGRYIPENGHFEDA
jgi:Ni/Fe-hydrogenase b-type cytochrome subunit